MPGILKNPTMRMVQILIGMDIFKYIPTKLKTNKIPRPKSIDFINHFITFKNPIIITT